MPGSSPGKKVGGVMLWGWDAIAQTLILSLSKDEGFNTERAAYPSTSSG